MTKKRIRIITKKQKITETKTTLSSLEQAVREPTFVRGRPRRMPSLPLALPFGSPEPAQTIPGNPKEERTGTLEPETTSREAFSYERPGTGAGNNGTTYRIAGATNQTDNQVYRSAGETKLEEDRRDRFNPGPSDTNRLRDTNELAQQSKQDRYQGASQSYQSAQQGEKKNTKELERSKF